MQRQSGSFALPNIRGIAVIFVQLHGGFYEFADGGGGDGDLTPKGGDFKSRVPRLVGCCVCG